MLDLGLPLSVHYRDARFSLGAPPGIKHGARDARRLTNGLDGLALTKLDVLDGVDRIDICTAYRCDGRTITEFPSDPRLLGHCTPVYETMPGWTQPTRGVRRFEDLPAAAQRYIAKLEEVSGVRAAIVSTGSERDDTIVRDDPIDCN